MTNSITKEYRDKLWPLYEQLLEAVSYIDTRKCVFTMEWGKDFPIGQNKGIMFVGRAVNSWFDYDENSLDRLLSVEEKMFENETIIQNLVRVCTTSAFWGVTSMISKAVYKEEDSYNKIAYSNVYKVAPWDGGNPNGKLQKAQLEICKKIFKAELDFLKPKYVVFFTGKWDEWTAVFNDLISDCKKTEDKLWDKYTLTVYDNGVTKFILSEHPQGKKWSEHAECIVSIINEDK